MTPSRWQHIQDIFLEAAERPEEERRHFLDEACAGDAELRREVESLLECDLPEQKLVDLSDTVRSLSLAEPPPPDPDLIGRRLGPYRLTRLLGHGGMGSVYLAIRDDDQFQKQVAIKLVKRGMDTEFILARFRHERQILASLDHPNIARLLDGGATEDGSPYFVMEYIDGLPIMEHCTAERLAAPERVRLFRSVCGAVQYAHQNLVVHRDLKPSNILVTREGVPKLLDFGIAKLLQADAGEETATMTRTGLRFFTPDYASPEQIRGEPIGTASDVYSLGAVLYELLTHQKAHRFTTHSPVAIESVVCRDEPERPSAAVGRSTGLDPKARAMLARSLEGDLDNIILMALRKEPQRRYHSAEQLSQDLLRHASGLPVLARQDTLRYRVGKFVGRHRLAVAGSVLLLLSLVGGIVAATWQARRAERRFHEVRTFANVVLFDLHDKISNLAGSTEARELLVRTVLQYLDRLVSDSGGDPALEGELAMAYERVGDVQGNPAGANLGHFFEAMASYRKALALLEKVESAGAGNERTRQSMTQCFYKTGDINVRTGKAPAAVEAFRRGLAVAEGIHARNPDDADSVRLVSAGYNRIGDAQLRGGDAAGALSSYRKGAETIRTSRAAPTDLGRRSLSVANFRVGDALYYMGDLAGGLEVYRAVLADRKKLAHGSPETVVQQRDLIPIHCSIAEILASPFEMNLGQAEAAMAHLREAESLAQRLASADPKNSRAQKDLAFVYRRIAGLQQESNPRPAADLWRRSITIIEGQLAAGAGDLEFRYDVALGYWGLGAALDKARDAAGAKRALDRAVEVQQSIVEADPLSLRFGRSLAAMLLSLGDHLLRTGDGDGALARYREALAVAEQWNAREKSDARLARELANCYERLGRLFAAKAARSRRVEDWRDAFVWHQKNYDIWRAWGRRAPANAYSLQREKRGAEEVAECERALTGLVRRGS